MSLAANIVNVGTVAGDGTGDKGQVPFQKYNSAITELYGALQGSVAFEVVPSVGGAQVLTLPSAVASGVLSINGLRQSVTAYTVSGNQLILPSTLNVLAGDLISFDYTPTSS